jgi:cell division protease FtsH
MAKELLEAEVIEGKTVRKIIKEYEETHNLPSRLAHQDKEENNSEDKA